MLINTKTIPAAIGNAAKDKKRFLALFSFNADKFLLPQHRCRKQIYDIQPILLQD